MEYRNGLRHYTLTRDDDNGVRTLGTWPLDDHTSEPIVIHTLERPWQGNQPFVSCIPGGTYLCEAYSSAKFPNVWEIRRVENRTHILIHTANRVEDVVGCVGVGLVRDGDGVRDSRKALQLLRETLPPRFFLTIANSVSEYP